MLYRPVVSQLSWPLVILWFWSGPARPSFCGPKKRSNKKFFQFSSFIYSSHFWFSPHSYHILMYNSSIHQYIDHFFPFFFLSKVVVESAAMYHGFACHVETNPQHPSITSIGCHLNWMSLLLLLSREFFPSLIFLRLQTFFDISHKCTCWWCWCEESKLYKSDKTCQHSNVVTRNYWVATAICYHRKYHLSQKQGFRPRKIKAKGRESEIFEEFQWMHISFPAFQFHHPPE